MYFYRTSLLSASLCKQQGLLGFFFFLFLIIYQEIGFFFSAEVNAALWFSHGGVTDTIRGFAVRKLDRIL